MTLKSILATKAPARTKPSIYPEPFASMMGGRVKHPLGDLFGLRNFGVNLVRLAPGAQSALMHRHSCQDEFIYVIAGHPTLITDEGEEVLAPGAVAGFAAGGLAHQLVNRSDADCLYLEVGDRTPGDSADYPNDDLQAVQDEGGALALPAQGRHPILRT
jgi:uncharacterized cupin superfamily protein